MKWHLLREGCGWAGSGGEGVYYTNQQEMNKDSTETGEGRGMGAKFLDKRNPLCVHRGSGPCVL